MEEKLLNIIDHDVTPGYTEAMQLHAQWPACILPAVAALRNPDLTPEEENHLREIIAISVGDRSALHRVLGPDGSKFDNFYPDPRHDTPSTVATIDDFIEKFASQASPVAIPNEVLQTRETYSADSLPEITDEEEESLENLEISEENAVNMIKKRKYEVALHIIQTLNLNNPEKSIYFADQIRFLRKLVLNDNNK